MTNPSFRGAIIAAVSSDPQAREDKASLGDQEKFARKALLEQGGVETSGPYILNGYSRTGYVNLSDAMNEIPPLAQAIQDLERNRYDVLIMDNLERLGDLAPMIFTLFSKHKKQIHSARQSGRIHDPETYNPSADESASIMMHIEGIIQKYRLNKLNRGYSIGMPRRIENGLNPSRTPYAYVYVNSKSPPIQSPEKVARWLQARDALMSGKTYTDIAKILGVVKSRVPYVLGNPFYAGVVLFQKVKTSKVNGKMKYTKLPKSKHLVGQGRHVPIITMEEHQEILAELDRRYQLKRRKTGWVFTGLIHCAVCGSLMRRGKFWGDKPMIFCRTTPNHVAIAYDEFFERIGKALGDALSKQDDEDLTPREDQKENIKKAITDLEQRRKNVIEMGEAGAMKPHEVAARVRELEAQAEKLQNDLERQVQERVNRAAAREDLKDLDLSKLDKYLKTGNPMLINRMLGAWLKSIRVGSEGIELIER